MIIQALKKWLKALVNFWNKGPWGSTSYPKIILPRKSYVSQINFDSFTTNYDLIVIRRTDKDTKIAFDELGKLRVDALIPSLKEAPELSMNLFGGLFEIKHLKYIPKKDGLLEWKNQLNINLKDYLDSFEIEEKVFPIFFLLNEIHNQHFPYDRSSQDPQIVKLKKTMKKSRNANFIISKGQTIVVHKPINLNYWHVEFHLKDMETNQIAKRKNIKSGNSDYWQNKLCNSALENILTEFAKPDFDMQNINKVDKSIYLMQ